MLKFCVDVAKGQKCHHCSMVKYHEVVVDVHYSIVRPPNNNQQKICSWKCDHKLQSIIKLLKHNTHYQADLDQKVVKQVHQYVQRMEVCLVWIVFIVFKSLNQWLWNFLSFLSTHLVMCKVLVWQKYLQTVNEQNSKV